MGYIIKVRFAPSVRYNDFWRIVSADAPRFATAKGSNLTPEFAAFKKLVLDRADAGNFFMFLRLTEKQYMYFVKHQSNVKGVDYILGGPEKTFWDDHEKLGDDFVQFLDA